MTRHALQSTLTAVAWAAGLAPASPAVRWKEFEAGVSAATARVRKSVDAANG